MGVKPAHQERTTQKEGRRGNNATHGPRRLRTNGSVGGTGVITVGATRRALWNVLEAVKNDRKPDPDDLREIEKRITDLCIST